MIEAVEDAIKAKIAAVLGSRIRAVETLPAGLDAKELERRVRTSPAIYVSFLGGTARDETGVLIDAAFGIFFLVGGPREEERRRGAETRSTTSGVLPKGGAYSLMQAVLPHLHGLVVAGTGSLTLREVSNLFSDELDGLGVTLYSAEFRVPLRMALMNGDDLAKFLDFYADWIVPAHDIPPAGTPLPYGEADTSDDVQLPQ